MIIYFANQIKYLAIYIDFKKDLKNNLPDKTKEKDTLLKPTNLN